MDNRSRLYPDYRSRDHQYEKSELTLAMTKSDQQKPDLNNPEQITRMVHRFYDALLDDELMAPLFLEVAAVDLKTHLPTISLYWQKMLLGDKAYRNNTMAKHRAVHAKAPFREEHFTTWLGYFLATVDTHFAGPYAEKAKNIAGNVIKNMRKQLLAA